jgi:hypothetical protein
MSGCDEQRDRRIGDAVERVPVPSRGEDFMPELLSRLDAVDAEASAAAETPRRGTPVRDAGGFWRRVAQRRASLVAAASVAAALLLVLVLAGVPGMRSTEPPPATAADKLMAAIDAGLAKVHTMSGRIVFDAPYMATAYPPAWATFAATSAGDRLVDVHQRADWARARRTYLAQVASLRKARGGYTAAQYASQMKGLRQATAVPTRSVWLTTSSDHTSSLAFFSADPLTRRPARARYFDLGWDLGLDSIRATGEAGRLWALSTQLRSVLSADAGVTVDDTTYQGRPAWRVTVAAANGTPRWYAIVDKTYGVTLAVQSPSKAAADLIAFHVTDLRVNEPLPAGTFAIRPSYEASLRLSLLARGAIVVKKTDLVTGESAVHYYPPTARGLALSRAELAPTIVPPGYRLTEIARHTQATPAVLVYRRGMSEFVVDSGPRNPGDAGSAGGDAAARGITAFDRSTWPEPFGPYDEFIRIQGGALNGAPAMLSAGVGAPASLYAWTDSQEASVNGDLTRSELLTVAGSLRPLRLGFHTTSRASLTATIVLLLALLAAAATAVVCFLARRRALPHAAPSPGVLAWPLIGLALVIVGAFMTWHALRHNGPAFHVSGWDEPLGRVVVALAIAAVCAAAWWLLARRPARVWLRTLAQALAALSLAGVVLALAYLPPTARFVVPSMGTNAQSGNVADESFLLRIVDSRFAPSASTGLYVSLLGALVLFVGVLMMRRREPANDALHSPDTRPDLA